MKEPGQLAYEASCRACFVDWGPWSQLEDCNRDGWATVEAAIYEDAAKIADKPEWIGCQTCGEVLNDWFTYKCKKYDEWIFSERGKQMILLDGAYHADRYFEKHICGKFDRLEHEKTGPAIAAAIRAKIGGQSE